MGGWHPVLFGPPPLMVDSFWVTSWCGWALKTNHKSVAAFMPTLLTRGSVSKVQLSERSSQFWLEQRVYFGEK